MKILLLEANYMINGIFNYKIFGHEFWITSSHISILIIDLLIIIFAIIVKIKINKSYQEPGTLQTIAEIVVEFIDDTVFKSMDIYGKKYRNYIGTLFIFIFFSNISGIIGLRAPTADYGITLSLGMITFILIQFNNIKYNKANAFIDLFKPLPFLFLINLIGEIAAPISLSLRLFGNITSGTVIMGLIYELLPIFITGIGIPGIMHIYFDLFSGVLQTYVFCILSMVFIRQKMPNINIKNN